MQWIMIFVLVVDALLDLMNLLTGFQTELTALITELLVQLHHPWSVINNQEGNKYNYEGTYYYLFFDEVVLTISLAFLFIM